MAIINRVERLELAMGADLPSDGPRNCGRGLKLPKGVHPQCCSIHNTTCWMRHDPLIWAQATMLLENIEKRLPEPDVSNPPPALIEVCRQMMLAKGYELEYEPGEEGAPDYYSPPPELVEEVHQQVLLQKPD